MNMKRLIVVLMMAALFASLPVAHAAQENTAPAQAAPSSAGQANAAGNTAQSQEEGNILTGLSPILGPGLAKLGTEGQVRIPEGVLFFNARDTKILLERMENLTSGDELGLAASQDLRWIAMFAFEDTGYVEDTGDAADIDADKLLKLFHEGSEAANKERAARGWAPSELVGWTIPPHYNQETKNLEWALRFKQAGQSFDNYSVRILGREGVMKVIFGGDNEDFAQSLEEARKVIAGYSFVPGRTHAEWRQGDKIAGYGLAALIAGGTLAAAGKAGLLTKFIKPLAAAALAVFAFMGKLFTGKKKNRVREREYEVQENDAPPADAPEDGAAKKPTDAFTKHE